jgi:predicted XRE-type DNA-binding protein
VLELTVRAELHSRLLDYIEELKLTPSQLVSLLGIHQPDVSNLLNGRISKFSVTKLIKFAGKLNLGVEVRLTKPSTGTVFISKRTRKLEAKQLHAVVSLMSASQTARMSSLIET